MRSLAWFLGALAAALVAASIAIRPPAAAPASIDAAEFSAARATRDVALIGRIAHPTGSRQNGHVRDQLIRRLEDLGLEVSVQRASAVRSTEPGWAVGGWIENIVAVLPGEDRQAPAVALMSHYDSAVGSPGAADDAAGVAASLEAVRALIAAEAPRRRDLVVLITDGEEQGLLGAQAFFETHPLSERIGAVVNLETRGAAGRAFMFETGPNNGAMMDLFAGSVRQPSTTSLAAFLYSVLPNDTDFSHARDLGVPGFNIAFIGEPFHYHSATSTPETLNTGSLQHMGTQALDLTGALLAAADIPVERPDAVFSDLFGLTTLVYPAWVGWILLAVSGIVLFSLIARADRGGGARMRGVGFGVLCALGAAALSAGLGRLIVLGTGAINDFVQVRPLLGRLTTLEIAMVLASLAAALFMGWLCCRGRPGQERRYELAALGLLLFGWIVALALQVFAPAASLIAAWPTLLGVLAALAVRRLGRYGWPAAALIGGVGAAWMFTVLDGVFLGVGWTLPEGPTALSVLALLPLAVLWARGSGARPALIAAGIALVAAGGLVWRMRAAPLATDERPLPTQVLYVADLDTGAGRIVAPLSRMDDWTARVLEAGTGPALRADEPALWLRQAHVAPAAPVTAAPPPLGVERLSDGRIVVRAIPDASVRELRLTVETSGALSDLSVQGRDIAAPEAGEPLSIRWAAPANGVSLTLRPPEGAEVVLRWATFTDGWPAEAQALPARPSDRMLWGSSDSLVAVGSRVLSTPPPVPSERPPSPPESLRPPG